MLSFAPITLEDKEIYTQHYQLCPVHYAEYSFFGLWGWKDAYSISLALDDGLCWLRSNGSRPGVFGPVGDWSVVDWEAVLSRHFGPGDIIYEAPKEVVEAFPQALRARVRLTEERDQWEYIHSVQELIALKGSKYAHKRNRVRTFLSNYEWDYFPMLPEDFPAIMEFQEKWRAHRDSTMTAEEAASLQNEDAAIHTALEHWEEFPFLGGILKIDEEIIGYTIAEELDSQTLDIRFEKAYGEYAGSYQALNHLFLENQGTAYTWVNREEDMGEPGLRAAKQSYNPVKMLEKYCVEFLS